MKIRENKKLVPYFAQNTFHLNATKIVNYIIGMTTTDHETKLGQVEEIDTDSKKVIGRPRRRVLFVNKSSMLKVILPCFMTTNKKNKQFKFFLLLII